MMEMNMKVPNDLKPQTVHLGSVPVSRFLLGGNPFGGYSHWTVERDNEMVDWYTMERVKETYRQIGRASCRERV